MNGKVRWGVLGTARIADAVIKGIRGSSNSELVAAASRDGERAKAWAGERGIPQTFGSYDEMLASDAVDAVYIPLPNALHAEWTMRAARQGKHVLCEKPLASNAGEVEAIIAAAQEGGVKVMEAFMYRFHPQTERLREMVSGGAIGEPKIVRTVFDFLLKRPNDVRWSKELAGGATMDVGCYCVNLANLLVGMPPSRVTASAVWAESGVDASLVGTLEYPNGVLATIDCSFQVGSTMQQWALISGSEGLIRVDEPFRIGEEDSVIVVDKADGTSAPEEVRVPGGNEYMFMVEHFAGAALSGGELGYTLQDSLVNMRVLDALREAARTGRKVVVGS
jgi:D-xylose 1-dehydrogenase (NADP+, D-xylono-1,5-lactone-forming)